MGGFIALVPARMASSRLPGKPLADLGGVPMVVRVARRAGASGASRVVVCADDARIVEACGRHGIESIVTSVEHATGTDRLAQAAFLLGLAPEQIVVNVQGDEPLIPPEAIRIVAQLLQARTDCDIATCAHRIERLEELFDPNIVKVVLDQAQGALLFSRAPIPWSRDAFGGTWSQPAGHPHGPLDPAYGALRHVGLYAYRAGFLLRFNRLAPSPLEALEKLEQLRALWHGYGIAVAVLDAAPPRGVDTPDDLALARRLLAAEPDARQSTGSG
jgi:3-deoxy-manno-octulosonate cytidylyltransferase (CMP-KDO synthetase)